MLAYLRKGDTFAELAAFGIGTATAWRYVTEPPPCWPPAPGNSARR